MEVNSFTKRIIDNLGIEIKYPVQNMHPLTLAFVGDSVFDLIVRFMLVESFDSKPHKLHVMASKRARASAQACAARAIFATLSDEESGVYMRARNSKPNTLPKNADPEDYALASAFEAVVGYLFILGEESRLMEVIALAIKSQDVDVIKETKVFRP